MAANATSLVYPVTVKGSQVDTYFGTPVADPYQWLEHPDAPVTAEWVTAQNQVTSSFLNTCPDKAPLEARLKEVYNYPRFSCPFKKGPWTFFFANTGLQNQSVLFKVGADGKEQLLLDPNTLSEDGTAALGTFGFSESGALLAYGVARSGSDWNTINVMRVEDGKILTDKVEWVKFSGISFTHDEKGFFYSRYPQPEEFKATPEQEVDPNFKRGTETAGVKNHMVYFHAIGTPQSDDILVHSTPDHPEWTVGAEVSDDGLTLLLTTRESCDTKNRLYLLPLPNQSFAETYSAGQSSVTPALVKLFDNFVAVYDYITNEGSLFFFLTNRDAGRYKVVAVNTALEVAQAASPDTWRTVIAEHDKDVLQSVTPVNRNQLLVVYSHDVAQVLSLYDQDGALIQARIALPDVGSIGGIGARKKDSEFFYQFSSFLYAGIIKKVSLTPSSVGGASSSSEPIQSVFREIKVKGFDASLFETSQVFCPSKDGTLIPMFVVHRRGLVLDGSHPTWLYGYGGFNISLPPSFSVARVVWMSHFNGIFALANLRGGGEYGEAWYKAGVKTKKQNVFDDFIGAAEYLIANKYTSPSKLAIHGGSNGGLLVCACLNQRPELFGCVIGQVGVLDMIKFHTWTIGHAWTSDYGSSAESEEMFRYLLGYSPVHTVRKDVPYPAVLLCTSDHDDRVVPLHSYKYISCVQSIVGAHPQQVAPLLIRVEEKAGHGAGMPLAKKIIEQADTMAFMAKVLGAKSDFPQ